MSMQIKPKVNIAGPRNTKPKPTARMSVQQKPIHASKQESKQINKH